MLSDLMKELSTIKVFNTVDKMKFFLAGKIQIKREILKTLAELIRIEIRKLFFIGSHGKKTIDWRNLKKLKTDNW